MFIHCLSHLLPQCPTPPPASGPKWLFIF
jgi:hypothetical protein